MEKMEGKLSISHFIGTNGSGFANKAEAAA